MKRILALLVSAALMAAALTGCGSGGEDALVSRTAFPEFDEVDMEGTAVTSEIFADYDATIVNFWNNGCGSCIAEMPELEELYQELQERNINLIGVGTDSGESREQLDTAREILREKGVTYINISPDPEGAFYQDFVAELSTYPTTCIVDRAGNIVGADIVGNVKKQLDTVEARLDLILAAEFGVERMAIVGGSAINTSFLDAGLLDEVSILIGAGIDGRGGMPAVFDSLSMSHPVIPLRLTDVQKFNSGAVWLRYSVPQ